MNYPEKLPLHKTFQFNSQSVLEKRNIGRIKSYYHPLTKDYSYLPMHSHDFYEINIITKGDSMHYINDKIYPAPAGAVFVIPPHIRHGYFSEGETDIFHIILDSRFISSYAPHLTALKGYSFLFDIEPVLRRRNSMNLFLTLSEGELSYLLPILDRLCEYDKASPSGNRLTKEFLALNVIAELCNFANSSTNIAENYPETTLSIIKIMEYISKNFKEKLNFQTLARDNNMSYPTFFRHFKKICKRTPVEYLTDCRINEAVRMIEQDSHTLTQIAMTCGFYDASHFTKSFIAAKGCTPTEYIQRERP